MNQLMLGLYGCLACLMSCAGLPKLSLVEPFDNNVLEDQRKLLVTYEVGNHRQDVFCMGSRKDFEKHRHRGARLLGYVTVECK